MLRLPLPFTDAVLLLSARWRELSGPARAGTLLFCVLVPVLLIALYRYELRLVSRLTATILLALRLTAVALLLGVVFLQPIVARSRTEELPGRVLVAVDRSDSAKVADPQRQPLEKLRLARALKLYEGVCPPALLDAWVRQYEEKGSPLWVQPDEFPDEAERRRALAEERRKQHDQLCQRCDRLTRLGVAQKLLTPDGGNLLAALAGKHRVEILGFAGEAWDVKPDQLPELFKSYTEAGTPPPGPAAKADDATDLRLPLTRALERSGKAEGKVLGVVLLSDGQHNKDDGGPTPVARAIELGQHELSVYPVVLGARRAPPDVAVASVRAPAAAFKDVEVPVEARVKISGLGKQEVLVELQRPGEPPLQELIRHDGTDQYHTVRFQVKLDRLGTQTLTVQAKPSPGEVRADNNSRPVAVNVADDKARVLLVDGEARWEYHYLANALARDRTVQVQSIVFNQPRLGKVPEEELEKAGNPRLRWPADPDALAGYDGIVLGDVTPEQLPLADRVRLEQYVADRGGTLVIVAGKRAMPLEFVKNAVPSGRGETDPLLRLLPILEPRVIKPVKGFPVTLTHQGKLTQFLQLDPAPDKSESRWAGLPPHYWAVVGRAKPGATVLATLPDGEAPPPREPEGEQDPARLQGLVVRQNYGFGRVLYVGLDSTWRWRYKVGDAYHHRFWGQVVRWAAADKPLVAGNEFVRFGTREPVYRQGAEVDLVARLGETVKPLAPDAPAAARVVLREDGREETVALVRLARGPAQPRVLEGRLHNLPPGRYEVELDIPELADKLQGPPGPDGKPAKARAFFSVAPAESEETIELAANWPLLEDLAAKSGGRVFTPENAAELADLITRKSLTREYPVESKLWEDWTTLALFLTLLTVEWVIRKWAGLP